MHVQRDREKDISVWPQDCKRGCVQSRAARNNRSGLSRSVTCRHHPRRNRSRCHRNRATANSGTRRRSNATPFEKAVTTRDVHKNGREDSSCLPFEHHKQKRRWGSPRGGNPSLLKRSKPGPVVGIRMPPIRSRSRPNAAVAESRTFTYVFGGFTAYTQNPSHSCVWRLFSLARQ